MTKLKNKKCSKCKRVKPIDSFCYHPKTRDKLQSTCKVCQKDVNKLYRVRHHAEYLKAQRERRKQSPWLQHLAWSKTRCTNKKCTQYRWYGGKGIKCLLTPDEIKELWFRDKAWLLDKPSIDRKDSHGDYSYTNCRFIECIENSQRTGKFK
jgi:hypothetical protein